MDSTITSLGPVHVACVVGARPNFMKIKPVLDALEQRDVRVTLIHTGQHYDAGMSDVFFHDLGLRRPDHDLGVGSGSQAGQAAAVMVAVEPLLDRLAPDVVVVVGDVNSTMAVALVAAKLGCRLAHVEAGLRSRDWRMPEEVNRVVTDRVSDYLFAPSLDAADNLRNEGYREDQIHVVGNVMVDTLLSNLERARARPVLDGLGLATGRFALVTLHRPATVDDPGVLRGVIEAIGVVAGHCPVVFPVHPRTRKQMMGHAVPDGVRLIDPVGYLDFVALEAAACLVLTDSGGVQEETTVLGVPCLTLRDNTERPVTVTEGTNVIAGLDPGRIVELALGMLNHGVAPRRPYLWDGKAGERVADVLVDPAAGDRGHPTDLA